MNGRRSQYKGGPAEGSASNSKWTQKGDKDDKGKKKEDDMCITNKEKNNKTTL